MFSYMVVYEQFVYSRLQYVDGNMQILDSYVLGILISYTHLCSKHGSTKEKERQLQKQHIFQ